MEAISKEKCSMETQDYDTAMNLLRQISTSPLQSMNTTDLLCQCQLAIDAMVSMWMQKGDSQQLGEITSHFFPVLAVLPKMKISNVLSSLFATANRVGLAAETQLELCQILIEWCRSERRNFIRQRLQFRYVSLLLQADRHQESLDKVQPLIREGTKLDDKLLLTELYLLASQCYYALQNYDKSNGTLIAARANSNNTYCEQSLQAKLDFQSGILALKSNDRNTAYSFFCEAFQNYEKTNPSQAEEALKFMLICKICTSTRSQIIPSLVRKNVEKYQTRLIEGIQNLTESYSKQNTSDFRKFLNEYADVLLTDNLSSAVLNEIYSGLVDVHLTQVIEPYSRVEILHLANIMHLPEEEIESKLSRMILDKRINALIDQQKKCLVMKSVKVVSNEAKEALGILENLDDLVSNLIRDYGNIEAD